MTNPPANRQGCVWLVGAGPGDPGLITVKGLRCVAQADVVVYDALCNPVLLQHARPESERIYAGKQAGRHTLKQDEINELLRAKAAEGHRVCRLKGGDPFVFGRGGEEALYLREHGIPFEIVPGVTSAVAVPAYAGIPVTHRNMATSVRFITGHEDPTKPESQLDFAEIAATRGTLVFLMGVQNLAAIAGSLIAAGKPADTPAAVISDGTSPRQRTVVATLATIADAVAAAGIVPPAITVVGEVAQLRAQLHWFEDKPFFGRAIMVTRARAQISDLVQVVQAAGGEAIEAPAIRIEPLADSPEMRAAAKQAATYDWVLLTSANGVDALMESLRLEGLDSRALASVRVGVIGPGTAERLLQCGIRADLMPERFVAEALLEALEKTESFRGQRYLVPRADLARPELVEGLRAHGAEVDEIQAYRTVAETALAPELLARLEEGTIDLVTFTSSSTVRNFVNALPEAGRAALLAKVRAASIGPVTSDTLREMGIAIAVQAEESTIPGLTAAMARYFADGAAASAGAPAQEGIQS